MKQLDCAQSIQVSGGWLERETYLDDEGYFRRTPNPYQNDPRNYLLEGSSNVDDGAGNSSDGVVELEKIWVTATRDTTGIAQQVATGYSAGAFGVSGGSVFDNFGNVYGAVGGSVGLSLPGPSLETTTIGTLGHPAAVLPGASWNAQLGYMVVGGDGSGVNQFGSSSSLALTVGVNYTSPPAPVQEPTREDGWYPGGTMSPEWEWVNDPHRN